MTQATTLGELRASGYPDRTVKQELRANLLDRLELGQELFPGILGFDDTVLPGLERGILAGPKERRRRRADAQAQLAVRVLHRRNARGVAAGRRSALEAVVTSLVDRPS